MVESCRPIRLPPPYGRDISRESQSFILNKIKDLIRQKGKISFRELMETLLYQREHGFYTRYLRIGVGMGYHFSTRPVRHSPDYGQAFASRIARFIELLKMTSGELDLVALGDGTGILFRDTLNELSRNLDLYPRLNKTSIELVPRFAVEQRARLAEHNVRVINGSAVELDQHFTSARGVFFCNELFDQFPVSKVVTRNGQIREVYVTLEGDKFKEVEGPPSDPDIIEFINITRRKPRANKPVVLNIYALKLLRNLAKVLKQGAFFIVDYNTSGAWINRVTHPKFGRSVPLVAQTIEKAIGKDVTTDVDFYALWLIAKHFGFKVLFENSELDFLQSEIPKALWNSLGEPMRVLALAKGDY